MEIIIGIIDTLLTCILISKIYNKICKTSKTEEYILGFILFLFQLIYYYLFFSLNPHSFLLIVYYALMNVYPFIFYLYLKFIKKYNDTTNIFLSISFSLLYQSTHTFLSVTSSSITGDFLAQHYEPIFFFIINLVSYFIIEKIITYFRLELNYFDRDYMYPFLKKVLLIFILLYILSFISDIVSTIAHLNSFGSILSSIVFICLLLTFFAMNSHKDKIEKEIALNQKKFEQRHLQNYTDEIVGLYNEIRGFRHDYAGMLVCMQMAIDSGDLQEIDRVYNEVLVKANLKLRSDKYTYFDLNNIEDSALRSLIAQAIVYAGNNGVEFSLEVKDTITNLQIELLDLVRIMSVLLNNAVEGSAESCKKKIEVAVIKMDYETVIVIQNSCKVTSTHPEDLFALGFSTKGANRGIGLNNVKEILDKYENIILETVMEDSTFRQVIRFKREFE
ncbi:competence system sensor histidine kinase ComD [Streptococcus sp. SK643]|mgnify:CR=1 FL=1|uniref:competence system sensor histidine kinase ComD n=1 Tax=Streptococcus sp. SK643 TaxID=1095727 RepID=UPI00025B36D5|nr:competence system sensor histidine kinase ComD [Streptococcus sp. SK643]EIF39922.1 GHKL domain protein [Streptococcus sp. SK643]